MCTVVDIKPLEMSRTREIGMSDRIRWIRRVVRDLLDASDWERESWAVLWNWEESPRADEAVEADEK